MFLSDREILHMTSGPSNEPLLQPMATMKTRDSSGLTGGIQPAGYDLRLSNQWITSDGQPDLIDFRKPLVESDFGTRHVSDTITIGPGDRLLGVSEQYFVIPPGLVAFFFGKSTLERVGLIAWTAPIDPGFRGNLVIEMLNTSRSKMTIYANMPIGQVLFAKLSQVSTWPYNQKGRYQGQQGLQVMPIQQGK